MQEGRRVAGVVGVLLGIALGVAPTMARSMIVVAEAPTLPPGREIVVIGNRAYLVNGDVRIFDISRPLEPELLGSFGVPALGVRIAEPLAFAFSQAGLSVVDVADPNHPVLLASALEGERVFDIAVAGDVLYAVVRRFGSPPEPTRRVTLDISDPANPITLSDVPTRSFLRLSLAVSGPRLVTCGETGLRVFDASDPSNPVELSSLPLAHACHGVRIAGDTAFLIDDDGLLTFDLSDAADPRPLSFVSAIDALRLRVFGEDAFVLGSDGLSWVDVSNPMAPTVLGSIGVYRNDIAVLGSDALMVGYRGWTLMDITDPGGSIELGRSDQGSGSTQGLIHRGDRVYTLGPVSLGVVDVSDLSDPRELGYRGAGSGNEAFDFEGPLAAVSSSFGVQLLDVTNEALPEQLGAYRTEAGITARGIDIQGSLAYATTSRGLEVLDISDPLAPAPIALLPLDLSPVSVVVEGERAFIAGGPVVPGEGAGLRVVDVRQPRDPVLIGALPLPESGRALVVSRGRAYVAAGKSGLRILDVSDPTLPRELGSLPTARQEVTSTTRDVAVSGRIAYVAEGDYGLRVVDVSDPANPLELGSRRAIPGTLTRVESVDARHGIAFVGDSGDFVRVFDFRDMLSGGIEVETRVLARGRSQEPFALVRLVLFGSELVDAELVDPGSLGLGVDESAPFPRGRVRIADENRDGYPDLVAFFWLTGAGALETEDEICLAGRLRAGRVFEVCDAPRLPSPRCGLGFETAPLLVGLMLLARGRARLQAA